MSSSMLETDAIGDLISPELTRIRTYYRYHMALQEPETSTERSKAGAGKLLEPGTRLIL